MRTLIRTLLVAAVAIAQTGAVLAAKRVAFVVGINEYDNVEPLQKAVNDARAMGEALESIGFEVLRGENLTRRDFNRSLLEFSSLTEAGDTAVFFYAGHGVQIEGRNFLLPRDIPAARPGQESFVAAEAIAVDSVLDTLRARGVRISLLVLDACRDNPFAREGTRSLGGTRGLARMVPPEGSFIMYSAGTGQSALDRLGDDDPNPNSVFTRSLIPLLLKPGLTMTETAREVRREVQELASTVGHEQRPAYYDEITSDFVLTPGGSATPPTPSAPPAAAAPEPGDKAIELAFWNTIRESDNPAAFRSYLAKYPDGDFAALAQLRITELEGAATPPPEPSEPPDTSKQDAAVELAFWNAVAASDDPANYRAYLEKYPGGTFATIARLRIDELSRPAPPPAVAPTPAPSVPEVADPSFDCSKAGIATEFAICQSPEIAKLDREMANLYRMRRNQGGTIRSQVLQYQRAWLKQRNACGYNIDCLREQYRAQINFLTNFSG